MGKGMVILAIIFILLMGGIAMGYFFIQKPSQVRPLTYHNISIRALDESTLDVVLGNYSLYLNNGFFNQGTTKVNYVLEKVPVNGTVTIFVNSPGYYTTMYLWQAFGSDPVYRRADVELKPQGEIKVEQEGRLAFLDNPINLNISSTAYVKGIHICLRWSANIITAQIANYSTIEVPERLENLVDKCYKTQEFLDNSSVVFPIEFKKFRSLDPSDEIKVYILDVDITPDSYLQCPSNCYTLIDEWGQDIGIPDYLHIIK